MADIEITRVNHVAFPISDRKKTLPFYRDVLGISIIPSMVDNQNVIWTQLADGTMLHPIEPSQPGQSAGHHVALQVADFDAAVAKLEELGIEIDNQGERHDGQRYLFIYDPDGNRVELTTASGLKPSSRVADEWGFTTEPD